MTRSLDWSVIKTWLLGKKTSPTGTLSLLGPEPATPAMPYCQTMCPEKSTAMTRLSAQPAGISGITPGGTPVPAMNVNEPTRSVSFGPMIVCGPGLHNLGLPEPNDHTTL